MKIVRVLDYQNGKFILPDNIYLLKPNTDTDNITEYQILIFARLPDINYSPNNIRLNRILKYSVSTLKFLLGKNPTSPKSVPKN